MSAMPPESFASADAVHGANRRLGGAAGDEAALAQRWLAVHEAAAVVRALAGLAPDSVPSVVRRFPAAIAQAGGQRAVVARQGMADLAVILETGIRALLTIHGRGVSPLPAAQALWAEFCAARDALLALAPQERKLIG